jgi:hypothetical protein
VPRTLSTSCRRRGSDHSFVVLRPRFPLSESAMLVSRHKLVFDNTTLPASASARMWVSIWHLSSSILTSVTCAGTPHEVAPQSHHPTDGQYFRCGPPHRTEISSTALRFIQGDTRQLDSSSIALLKRRDSSDPIQEGGFIVTARE